MLNWKKYKSISISFIFWFFVFLFFLYGKIDFDTIVLLSVITAGLIETIYDIKNRTVGEYSYSNSDPFSHHSRYFIFIITFALWLWLVYDIFIEIQLK